MNQQIDIHYRKKGETVDLMRLHESCFTGNIRDYLTDIQETELGWIIDHTKVNNETILRGVKRRAPKLAWPECR